MKKPEEILDGLNDAQKEAVVATDGPVLILAGAGSGKTRCLAHRIAYLMSKDLAGKDEILGVSFTNKAAEELGRRVLALLDYDIPENNNIQLFIRRKLPWLGTFHSICVRILRMEHERAGLSANFTIFDSDDSLALVRQRLKAENLDVKQYSPQAIRAMISSAKNEMIKPTEYANLAQGHFQEIVARIYKKYQEELVKHGAVDFDDLILLTVDLLNDNPDICKKYQQKYKYIQIDEYQDTNLSQLKLTLLLTNPDAQNICVVGDDFQCLLKGLKIITEDGYKKIEDIKKGDLAITASGFGTTNKFEIEEKAERDYNGTIVEITTQDNEKIELTPEHICFARLQPKIDQWFIYLMFREDKGYRIGITKGVRFSGKCLTNGLSVRANQERADKMWIIRTADSLSEARYYEELISIKYQIPKILFYAYKRDGMTFTQEQIDNIFKQLDTRSNAEKLMEDYLLFEEYPHSRPQAVTSENSDYYPGRSQVYLIQFGDSRMDTVLPWHAHRIRITTANKKIQEKLENYGFSMRADKKSKRVETSRKHLSQAVELAEELSRAGEIDLCRLARLTKDDKNFSWQPASHLRVGMLIPTLEGTNIVAKEIKEVKMKKYAGKVYDLNVKDSHTFAVNNMVVHNSIYAWRGANFRNILEFNKHFPTAQVFKLEQNYRSTENIINAAQAIIDKVSKKSDKKLWTENGEGLPVTVYSAADSYEEAEFIADEIRALSALGNGWNKHVLLYRTNAQSRLYEEIFLQKGVPYRLIGAMRFYERKEVKDLLAYIRYILNPGDLLSFTRAVNTPPRGIGPATIARGGPKIDNFNEEIRRVDSIQPPQVLLDDIIKRFGYKEYTLDGTPEGEARWENVEELVNLASQFENINEFLEHVSLVSDVDNYDSNAQAVTLMTLHSAKGLEFETVFIVGMEEGSLPHMRALTEQNELDEERRLCYVGMTRARKRLYLTNANQRVIHGMTTYTMPSRFIDEIDPKILDRL